MCSDCETYISADDLRINLWNLEVSDQSFNIVDIKPTNMEDLTGILSRLFPHHFHLNFISNHCIMLSIHAVRIFNLKHCEAHTIRFINDRGHWSGLEKTEVITSAEFHPTQCNMLAYSSSKGSIRLIDMRQSALCDRHSKLYVSFLVT